MSRHFWLVACLVLGPLGGAAAWAEPVPAAVTPGPDVAGEQISLRRALAAAWGRAVLAREQAGLRQLAEAARTASTQLLPAPPSVTLNHRNDRLQDNAGKRETEISVAVPLWLPGQQGAQAMLAETAALRAQAAEWATRLRLAGEVREAAWQLAMAEADLSLAEVHARTHRQLAEDVARRVRAGELARSDALAAHAEQAAALAQQAHAQQLASLARARWALLTGLNTPPQLPPPDPGATVSGEATTHPELKLAEYAAELARRRLDWVRHSRREAPSVTVGFRRDEPGRDLAREHSVLIGLQLPLATEARNRTLDLTAHTEWDVARTEAARLRERIELDIEMARQGRAFAAQQLLQESVRARLLRERAHLIHQSFRAGETALAEWLRTLATAAQSEGAAARAGAALGLAHARLEQALGVMP